jgi:hypothetical protein
MGEATTAVARTNGGSGRCCSPSKGGLAGLERLVSGSKRRVRPGNADPRDVDKNKTSPDSGRATPVCRSTLRVQLASPKHKGVVQQTVCPELSVRNPLKCGARRVESFDFIVRECEIDARALDTHQAAEKRNV